MDDADDDDEAGIEEAEVEAVTDGLRNLELVFTVANSCDFSLVSFPGGDAERKPPVGLNDFSPVVFIQSKPLD